MRSTPRDWHRAVMRRRSGQGMKPLAARGCARPLTAPSTMALLEQPNHARCAIQLPDPPFSTERARSRSSAGYRPATLPLDSLVGSLAACPIPSLSARQAPYHTVAIPPSGEAAYVIDGLLYHEADLSIGTHHTDGGAVSDHNFALAYLLGFYFAPRISQPGRAAPLHLWTNKRLAGARTVHRRARRRKADHNPLERCLAPRDIGPHRDDQRFAPPQAPGSLSPSEWPGVGPTRNRTDRAHAVHARLARTARSAAAGDRGAQQGRSAQCPRPRWLLPPPRPVARSCARGAATPCERDCPRHRRYRALEHRISRPCAQ